MTDLSGQSLGRYHILEPLGEGGMATVYKAYDTHLEADVAVKVIRTEKFTPEVLARALKRFEREAKALARLTHPNIVKVTDYGEFERSPFLVMPYLPGGSLKALLAARRRMPWREAARLLAPIARALEFAHSQQVIHRDVKPANILLTQSGQPMLTDFGVAKVVEEEATQELTGTAAAVGTPEYMAPEQTGRQIDARVDVYALGVVFYEMITGRRPYEADTPLAVLIKQASEPLPRPGRFVPDLPEAVERVLLKALAKRPEDRYADMGAMAAALEGLPGGEGRAAAAVPETSRDDKREAMAVDTQATIEQEGDEVKPPVGVASVPPRKGDGGDDPIRTPAEKGDSGRQARRAEKAREALPWKWLVGVVVVGLVLVCAALAIVFWKPLGAALFPTRTPAPTSTPRATSTPVHTATPQATATPRATATPVLGVGSIMTREADGMEMVYVPGGEFEMGSNDGYDDERPVHTVVLDGFWMDRTEVTNAMYAAFLNSEGNQSEGGANWLDAGDDDVRIVQSGGVWQTSEYYKNHPVANVTWYGAQAYCKWAGAHLPTEAEWEYAARGDDGRIYPWGDGIPNINLLNYEWNVRDTTVVGSYPAGASPFGALDMAGNVWEWVADWYGTYPSGEVNNPTGPTSGTYRVLRGGSWSYDVYNVRAAYRYGLEPVYAYDLFGFRCSRSLP